jgi:adenine-specific DNA-methyltransferase
MSKQKLELTWIGKENRPRLEPRILLEKPTRSYHAAQRITDNDIFDNRLISGDNLLALKALEQEFEGKIKCIYIDPPYNTGSAFTHFEDGIEHSAWLCMMRDRLQLLWGLLRRDDGVILISINDDESHYLKVLCDEIFGRSSFVANLVWNYEGNTDNQAQIINYHEYILVYSKTGSLSDIGVIDPNVGEGSKLHRPEIRNTVVKNGPKNPLSKITLPVGFPSAIKEGTVPVKNIAYPRYSGDIKIQGNALSQEVIAESGWSSKSILLDFINTKFQPVLDSKGQSTRFELTRSGAIEAVKLREQRKGHFTSVLRGFGTTNQMRLLLEEMGLHFDYPKPIGLIAYLIRAFSDENDWILDSFAGSGTTGHAVMQVNREDGSNRKFILVEVKEDTVDSIILPRLKYVIDGFSKAGIEQHGGGFRFFKLAPSLLAKDKWDNWVISKEYNAAMLAEAICKLEGFTYAPSETLYWQQGYSTERDFLYVTTAHLTPEQLQQLSEEVGPERTLLVLCTAFRGKSDRFPNLTVKKIPTQVLSRCEWGHDDYSLQVENLPKAPPPAPPMSAAEKRGQQGLFSDEVGE